jgi:carboxypeptidase T
VHRTHRRLFVVAAIAAAMGLAIVPSASGGPSAHGNATADALRVRTYRVDGVSTKEVRTAIARTGASIEFVGRDYVIVRALSGEERGIAGLGLRVSAMPDEFPPGDEGYHDYGEVKAALDDAQASYPGTVQEFSIGTSYEGREIWAVKISDNVATDEDEPEVLFDCLHHAREHLTVEECLYILQLFTKGVQSDPRLAKLVKTREIYVVPMVNPDGGEFDISGSSYGFWRKNRQPNPDDIGTDLNRNYSYRWGCCGGSSGFGGSETYRGQAPFDAPESTALASFIESRVVGGVEQITTGISFHTYGQLVLWPYGYTFTDVPSDMTQDDHDVFQTLGRRIASSTCQGSNCYTPEQSSDLYITDGTSIDWMYGRHRIFAITIEMYPTNDFIGFYPPDEDIKPQTRRLTQAVATTVKIAACPYKLIGKEQQYCS